MERDRSDDEKLDKAVEDMQSDVDEMRARSEKLGDRIAETRSDWRTKQQDDSVAGAQPPVDDAPDDPADETA